MRGYKVFNEDWTCNGYQYKVGKTYEHDGEIKLCESGFHFCKKAENCFSYYSFDPRKKVAEVYAHGQIIEGENKYVTDKIEIIRELPWAEVLEIVNSGKGNTGHGNSGNGNSGDQNGGSHNSGHYNSGHYNSGNCNSGNGNSGHDNSGNRNSGRSNSGNENSGNENSGHYNSGWSNSGNRNKGNGNSGNANSGCYNSGHTNSGIFNSGHYNSGNRNSGDGNSGHDNSGSFNSGNRNSGIFNTKETPIYAFDKPTDLTFSEIIKHKGYIALLNSNLPLTEWIEYTNKEKVADPEKALVGGYLKTRTYKEAWAILWENLSEEKRATVQTLPNFDPDIFFEITGIDLRKKDYELPDISKARYKVTFELGSDEDFGAFGIVWSNYDSKREYFSVDYFKTKQEAIAFSLEKLRILQEKAHGQCGLNCVNLNHIADSKINCRHSSEPHCYHYKEIQDILSIIIQGLSFYGTSSDIIGYIEKEESIGHIRYNEHEFLYSYCYNSMGEFSIELVNENESSETQSETTETAETQCVSDKVNHPQHYGGSDNIYETIKVIEAWNMNFNLGNALKYISRCQYKGNCIEDLEKAVWYLQHEIDLQNNENKKTQGGKK